MMVKGLKIMSKVVEQSFNGVRYSKYQHKLQKEFNVYVKAIVAVDEDFYGFELYINKNEPIKCEMWQDVEDHTVNYYKNLLRKEKIKRLL